MNTNFSFADVTFRTASEIIDTHCHYNMEPLYPEWRTHWQKAQANGLVRSIIPGTDLETSRRAVEIAEQEPALQALVGIHPGLIIESTVSLPDSLRELEALLSSDKVVGIGEIGLDYFHTTSEDERAQQREWLAAQLELAQKYSVPIALHVRDKESPEERVAGNAYWDTMSALEASGFTGEFVLHCVSGPVSYVTQLVAKGAFVSFAGNLTYPKAQAIREYLKLVQPNKILCETDAPYLPPQQYRGQVCEPWMIRHTAEYLQQQLEELHSQEANKVQ